MPVDRFIQRWRRDNVGCSEGWKRVSYMNTNTREGGNNNIIVAFECSGKLFRNSGCENKKWLNAARCHQKWEGEVDE